ncbi:MAG: sensor histidine kinase [Bacteroidales bacterium]|nr:sensor histidine kinase [Bacteroidales bacterium]
MKIKGFVHTVTATIVLLYFSYSKVYSQSLDSLESVFANESLAIEEQIKICDDLSWGYLSSDFDKSKKYANAGIKTAETAGNAVMLGTLYRNLGVAYYMVSKMDSAEIYLEKALQFAMKAKSKKLEAAIYGAIGNIYNTEGEYPKALEFYNMALPIAEKLQDKYRIALLQNNIGTIYLSVKDFHKAEEYLVKSLKTKSEIDDTLTLGYCYNNLAKVYFNTGDGEKALQYANKAVELFRNSGEVVYESIAFQLLSMVYYQYLKDYKKAESYALQSLTCAKESNLPAYIASSLNTLSNVLWHQSKFSDSYLAALEAVETDTSDMEITTDLYKNLVRTSIIIGKQDDAVNFLEKYHSISYQWDSEKFQKSLSEMEVKYETEKKELKITSLEKERKFIILLSVLGGILLITIIVLIAARQKVITQKRKIAEQKVAQLEQEKQLIATKSLLEGEATERARLSKDLHDGLGGLLSVTKHKMANMKGSLTIPEEQVETFNSALEMLDNSIKELRRVAHNLMPESLMRYGLSAAIKDFCESIDKATYHFYGVEKRIDEKLEVAAFRIVSELVNNALKHANANKINVQLVQEQDRISLTVYDDGCGFDPKSIDKTKSVGLNSIEQRVISFNGRIDILSEPGKGTEVTVEFKC